MKTDKRSVLRRCRGGCGRSVQGSKLLRCVYCRVAHGKATRKAARDQRRALRQAPVDRDMPTAVIDAMLAAGDARLRAARQRITLLRRTA
jgi:hypothetical protein